MDLGYVLALILGTAVQVLCWALPVPRALRLPIIILSGAAILYAIMAFALIGASTMSISVSRWAVLAVCVLVALVVGELAWRHTRPGGPTLRVAPNLEEHDERQFFTLSIWNDGRGLAIADASITKLVGGEQTHEKEVPIRLGFVGKNHLSAGERGRIVVVSVDRAGDVLKVGFGGFRHLKIHNAAGDIIGASFCVRVDFLGTPLFEERAFRLVPDNAQPLLYRAEAIGGGCLSLTTEA